MIFILTGPVHSGKTAFLKKLIERLKDSGISVAGYWSERVSVQEKISGYDLVDLDSRRQFPLLRKTGHPDWPRTGVFYFQPEGLAAARKIIHNAGKAELLVVDELGPAEISGSGLWPVLSRVIDPVHCLLVVRQSLATRFINLIKPQALEIFRPGGEDRVEFIVSRIVEVLRPGNSSG